MFPFPTLRDRLIAAVVESEFDDDDFLYDIIGDIFNHLGCIFTPKEAKHSLPDFIDPVVLQTKAGVTSPNTNQIQLCGHPGILAWSDPWHSSGWEISETFARKWSFLLKDCPEIILSTNKWRLARGEEVLPLYL
jgi:hypothetical protein